jgi:CBS domain-containing protein
MTMIEGLALTVRDLPPLPLATVSPTATLQDAARAILRSRTPGVIVETTDAILTEHDIVRAVARGDSPQAAACAFATPDPRSVDVDATLNEVLDVMIRHVHRLLVVSDSDGKPLGFVSLIDVTSALLDCVDVPHWLSGLRVALRPDSHG